MHINKSLYFRYKILVKNKNKHCKFSPFLSFNKRYIALDKDNT